MHEVAVTHDRAAFAALKDLGQPGILVATPEDGRLLVDTWNLIPASELVRQETNYVESGAAVTLADAFPTLRADLEEDEELAGAEMVPCADIFEVIATERGTKVETKDFAKLGSRFLWKAELGLEEALRRIAGFLPFELSGEEIAAWPRAGGNRIAATSSPRSVTSPATRIVSSRRSASTSSGLACPWGSTTPSRRFTVGSASGRWPA